MLIECRFIGNIMPELRNTANLCNNFYIREVTVMITMKDMRITGVKVAYYYVCPTKLWLFSHNISLELDSEEVSIGKFIHESSYKRRRPVHIEEIAIDYIKKGDVIEIHEVKKAKSIEIAHRMQLLYYIYYLKNRGITAVGYIDYPLLRKREYVELDTESEKELKKALEKIQEIVADDMPPPKYKKICKKCAYAEFCFSEVVE